MVSGYADVVVMRTPWEGSGQGRLPLLRRPRGQCRRRRPHAPHPDHGCLTTITRLRGGVDGLSLGLCGDLKNGRTVHSLIKAMAKFRDIKFFLISPRDLGRSRIYAGLHA